MSLIDIAREYITRFIEIAPDFQDITDLRINLSRGYLTSEELNLKILQAAIIRLFSDTPCNFLVSHNGNRYTLVVDEKITEIQIPGVRILVPSIVIEVARKIDKLVENHFSSDIERVAAGCAYQLCNPKLYWNRLRGLYEAVYIGDIKACYWSYKEEHALDEPSSNPYYGLHLDIGNREYAFKIYPGDDFDTVVNRFDDFLSRVTELPLVVFVELIRTKFLEFRSLFIIDKR